MSMFPVNYFWRRAFSAEGFCSQRGLAEPAHHDRLILSDLNGGMGGMHVDGAIACRLQGYIEGSVL